jgi:hypothetical protein
MTAREQWDGGEWQEHCRRLLGAKYGENVQFVPDRVGGDGGLEAYRLDSGTVYQCYAPEGALTVQAQTDAQKNKIQRDIFKLVSKPDETVELLGDGYLITRWVLLTPECDDKEILKYARAKSFKTRSGVPRPPWCDQAFEIVVATDRDLFPVELAQLTGPTAIIRLNVPPMTDEDIYASIEEGVAVRLTEKLSVYPPLKADDTVLTSYRSEILYDYLYGKQQLAILEDRYSLAYSAVEQRARTTLRRLTQRLTAGTGDPADLNLLARELATDLMSDVPALARVACDDLAHYYLAAWWIQCPLRFLVAG